MDSFACPRSAPCSPHFLLLFTGVHVQSPNVCYQCLEFFHGQCKIDHTWSMVLVLSFVSIILLAVLYCVATLTLSHLREKQRSGYVVVG